MTVNKSQSVNYFQHNQSNIPNNPGPPGPPRCYTDPSARWPRGVRIPT